MKIKMAMAMTALWLMAAYSPARADDISNNFAGVTQSSLDAFTKDFGAAMGGGSFHTGKALGFPIGFDVGVDVPVVGVKDEDSILKDDGSTLIGKWAHVEVGLPAKINLIGRIGKIEDADAYGGGLRIGLFSSGVPGIPSVSLSGLYGKATHDYFDATTISGNVCLSFEIPFVHPYIGAGVDRTKVDVNAHAGVPPASSDLDSSQTGYRVEVGVNLSLIPFTYITLGGGVANGEKLYHAGAGVKF